MKARDGRKNFLHQPLDKILPMAYHDGREGPGRPTELRESFGTQLLNPAAFAAGALCLMILVDKHIFRAILDDAKRFRYPHVTISVSESGVGFSMKSPNCLAAIRPKGKSQSFTIEGYRHIAAIRDAIELMPCTTSNKFYLDIASNQAVVLYYPDSCSYEFSTIDSPVEIDFEQISSNKLELRFFPIDQLFVMESIQDAYEHLFVASSGTQSYIFAIGKQHGIAVSWKNIVSALSEESEIVSGVDLPLSLPTKMLNSMIEPRCYLRADGKWLFVYGKVGEDEAFCAFPAGSSATPKFYREIFLSDASSQYVKARIKAGEWFGLLKKMGGVFDSRDDVYVAEISASVGKLHFTVRQAEYMSCPGSCRATIALECSCEESDKQKHWLYPASTLVRSFGSFRRFISADDDVYICLPKQNKNPLIVCSGESDIPSWRYVMSHIVED